MRIDKQINIRGNANVVAHEVHIYMSPASRRSPDAAHPKIEAIAAGLLGIALCVSLLMSWDNPSLVAVLAFAFLLSIALLLRGKQTDGADKRGPEGHLQLDPERHERRQ
jgi:hypothetical protein